MESAFNPSDASANPNNLFGLPFTIEEAHVVVIPVPWEGTASYGKGTAYAPQAILKASQQVDLYDPEVKNAWKSGIAMLPIPDVWDESPKTGSSKINEWVNQEAKQLINNNKIPVVLGGEHSAPLGLIQALASEHADFGILQIDAHFDLRKSYEDVEFSHASIMYNALKVQQVSQLVAVGIRDYCDDEVDLAVNSNGRIHPFYDHILKEQQFKGRPWHEQCEEIINLLPQKVYISFDIDGLHPSLCPSTGTPVPGGLQFEEAIYLVKLLVDSGRTIIGFDLCEVGQTEWDANVGARILYRLCNLAAKSHPKTFVSLA